MGRNVGGSFEYVVFRFLVGVHQAGMILQRIQDKLLDSYYLLKGHIDVSPYGQDTQDYWIRRRELFSLFDRGIQTDAEGLYSVTPEAVANQIAKTLDAGSVLDAFCGIGGNAIGFARAGKKVAAVDVIGARLAMARHNASVYGVDKQIEFLHLDVFEALLKVETEAVFLDPPWGGVGYSQIANFGLNNFMVDGSKLLDLAVKSFARVALRVPRQFNFLELDKFGRKYVVQDNYMRSKLYSKTVYFA